MLAKFFDEMRFVFLETTAVNDHLKTIWVRYNKHVRLESSSSRTSPPLTLTPLPSHPHIQVCKSMSFHSYILRYVLETGISFLNLGFELDLYAPHEIRFMLWYLDYLLNWMKVTVDDARAKIVRHFTNPGGELVFGCCYLLFFPCV